MSADTHVINWPIAMDYIQTVLFELLVVTIQPHCPSKQILGSCWLPLAWEASCFMHTDSMYVELL